MFTTDICKASVDPKWSSHYDLYLSRGDGITISVWNQKKIHKTQGSGFLGCVRITASTVQRLKDTGCKYLYYDPHYINNNLFPFFIDQRLDLCKLTADDPVPVKGQIIISLLSRDAITGCGNPLAIVGPAGDVRGPDDDEMIVEQRNSLPEGWEERKTGDGRVYFVNHVTKTTQWSRPTQPASMIQLTNSATSNIKNATENNSLTPPGPSRSTTMNNLEQSPPSGPLNEVLLVPLVVATAQDNRRHSNENLIAEIITGHISSSSSNNSIESNEVVGKVETPNQNLSPTTVTSISSPRNSVLITNSQLINTLSNNLGTLTIENVDDNSSNNHHNTNDNATTVATDESTISNSTPTQNNIRLNNEKTTNNFSSSTTTTTTTQQVPKNQTTNTTTTTTAAVNAQFGTATTASPSSTHNVNSTNERQESIVTTESQPATPQRVHQPQPQPTTPSSNEVINRHASDQGKLKKKKH